MFWVVENSKPVIDRLDQINTKQNSKLTPTFVFSTHYTKLPHKGLPKVLFYLIDFGCNGDSKKKIDFSFKKIFFGRASLKRNIFSPKLL